MMIVVKNASIKPQMQSVGVGLKAAMPAPIQIPTIAIALPIFMVSPLVNGLLSDIG
ncbi:MAG: hypothetical protein Q8Q48_01715 [Candidatus Staskawiczbacteria bacterium]|nr:hypothetical protein [Candidatus Staskawiczbacteria bacterium]